MDSIYEILDLLVDMKGNCEFIDEDMAELQKKTSAKIIETLHDRPGVILGDDVGMGKTYMAIATIYYFLYKYPDKPVVIVAPSWMLRKKWTDDIRKFIEINDRKKMLTEGDVLMIEKINSCENLKQFVNGASRKKIVVVPVDLFSSASWKHEKSFFLNCWFRHRSLRGKTREDIMKRLVNDKDLVSNPQNNNWMWTTYEKIPGSCYECLDKAYDDRNLSVEKVNEGIEYLRCKAMSSMLPEFSLFILDEAHKVKNPNTKKHQVLKNMLGGKFNRTLFLTATPFQLSENELFTVLELFEIAYAGDLDIDGFAKDCNLLSNAMKDYIASVSSLEQAWNSLRPEDESKLNKRIEDMSEADDTGDSEYVYKVYMDALNKKDELQKVMSRFVIRNVKEKSKYRTEIIGGMKTKDRDSIAIGSEHFIPFALWEKTLYEIFKNKDRTFIPTVKQSLTSSFEALKASSIYKREDLEALNRLKMLLPYLKKHPKMEELADSIADSLDRNEKTLIFCGRIETAKEMKRRLESHYLSKLEKDIEMLFKDKTEDAFENYHRRFYNKQDSAWYYLQENYIQSVLEHIFSGKSHSIYAEDIAEEVSEAYKKFNNTKKTNFMFLKRIIEQIVIREAISKHNIDITTSGIGKNLQRTIHNILDANYIFLGVDQIEGDFEKGESDYENEDRDFELRNISVDLIKRIMNYKGIWERYNKVLNLLDPVDREKVVDSLIKFMQRDKAFFIELKKLEIEYPDRERSELIVEVFSKGGEFNWGEETERFLKNYLKAPKAERENMLYGLRVSSVVDVISGEVSNNGRERIKDGFNTPFYPKVLISMSLAQEGIDLQKECRRVVHYDLEWNPASLEQRVGRIDRINSLISRLNPNGEGQIKLEIYYPYIKNTIDESIFKTVKAREKWFSFILGGMPDWESFSFEEGARPIPDKICKKLQIDLSVRGI